ncbi:MAG: tetratricopeptide repeat protein [Kiritimatiellia bacterium]|jgi:TolA-binding protein|nr:tetratricopeptide repeat protein [Kiritimatiellia bacterium]MDP6630828.1 tetratricopeptide repeat protein [Kiritimatiellia bacterium]MDP6811293.1 tetratricopeptide repeat protein [Kiritimatiellia bacterium]MDP7024093.1 tetratricopeptide repeat protein [Kiritimatiellia bacterium]
MTRRFLLLSLCALGCLVAAVNGQLAQEGGERLVLADGLFAREMYTLAAQEYEAILREEPDLAEADIVHFRLGECYRRAGKTLDADKHFGLVFKKYPKSELRHRAGFRRAGLFMDAGHHDAAADLYRAVLKESPPAEVAAACWYLLGEALLQLERDEEATEAFERVIKDFRQSEFHPYGLLKLGQVLVRGEDEKGQARAIKLFQQVADKPPDARLGAEGWFQVAESYYRAENFAKSADAYRKLGKTYPRDVRTIESRLHAAWAHHNASRYADALRLCDAAAAKGDAAAEWAYLKANCLRQLLRHGDAVTAYRVLLADHPASRFVEASHYELALALYNDGKYKDAVAEAEELVGGDQLQKDIYWLLAESYAALGQADDAVQYYRLIARDYPDSDVACEAIYRLAYHLQARSDFVQAAEQFASVSSRWPDHKLAPRALFAAGYCWSRADGDEKAVAAWRTLIQEHAADPLIEEAIFQKAMSEVRLKRDSDALSSLRELRRDFPNSAFAVESAYWEGRLLQQAGRFADAEESLRKVLAVDTRPDLKREAQLALAYVLQSQNKDQEAADRFQKLLGTPEGDGLSESLLEWLAQYRLSKKAYGQCVEAAERLVTEKRERKWRQSGWYILGRAYDGQGKVVEAIEAFERVIELGGSEAYVAEAALALGEAALEDGMADEAATYFERAASHPGGSISARARAYAGQGRAARATGDFDEAARYFMSVAILYNDPVLVPDCLAQAAACLKASGDDEGANRALAELNTRYPSRPVPPPPPGD